MLFVKRIRIGRWKTEEDCHRQMLKQLERQIEKPVKVPISTLSGLTIPGLSRKAKYPVNLQFWQLAALISASSRKVDLKEKSVRKILKLIQKPGKNSMQITQDPSLALLIFYLWENSKEAGPELEGLIADTYELLKSFIGEDGCLCYNKKEKEKRLVDTVGMACPFLIKYGIEKEEPQAIALAIKQIKSFYKNGFYKKTGLPFHSYDSLSLNKGGIIGWGRGCGWWAIGLMESYKSVRKSLNEKSNDDSLRTLEEYKEFLAECIEEFTQSLILAQMPNGAWSRHFYFDTVGDTSATAVLSWFLAEVKSIFNNDLAGESAQKALTFLMANTRQDGLVDFSQGDTSGIGFYSTGLIPLPMATAFCLRAYGSLKKI